MHNDFANATYPTEQEQAGNLLIRRIINDFKYHPATPETGPMFEANRNLLLNTAHQLVLRCPESRELSLALTHLEEAMFWANASIARH